MATYRWDFGFDFDAVQAPNGQSFLGSGFVSVGTPLTVVSPLNGQVNLGDVILLNAFNLTEGATGEGYSITSGSIIFSPGDLETESDSPFNIIGSSETPITIGWLGPASSLEVSPVFTSLSATFPVWTLSSMLTVANTGHYLFAAQITVSGPGRDGRVFRVDPEMIVEAPPG